MEWDKIGVTPYRKSKNSNLSKSNRKSKHKHLYEDCLIYYHWENHAPMLHLYPGKYCSVCGVVKSGNDNINTCTREGNFYRMLSNEEIKAKYPDLPIKELTI